MTSSTIKDLNYLPLDVESNIYGMTKLEFDDATTKILVATLDCRLHCINYSPNFKPQTREVEFTYIPSGAKIISIGALKRGRHDFVIGITHSLSPSVAQTKVSSSSGSSGGAGGAGGAGGGASAGGSAVASGSGSGSGGGAGAGACGGTTGASGGGSVSGGGAGGASGAGSASSGGGSSISGQSRDFAGDLGGHAGRQTTTYYFNIYASESVAVSSGFDLDQVAQGCQTIRLRYVPYHLYSSELLSNQRPLDGSPSAAFKRRPVWLLSGADECIHAFTEDQPYHSFTESPMDECFPELCDKQQSIALWIDVANIELGGSGALVAERAVALGFEDGSVRLYQSALSRGSSRFELVRASSFDAYTTIIPCVRLFTINSMDLEGSQLRRLLSRARAAKPDCDLAIEQEGEQVRERELRQQQQQQQQDPWLSQLNLLVVSSTNESLIFSNVLSCGLDDKYELPASKRLDCVTTAAVADTNASGHNDLLLGTHGKELLTYRYDSSSKNYRLKHVDLLNYPIFSLCMLDLTGDGLKDVTILLASGILIMQAAVKDVMELCRRRLDTILSSLDLK